MTIDTKTPVLSVPEYAERAEHNVATSHGVLRETLRSLGITRVTAEYDGYGDSGQFEAVVAYRGDAVLPRDFDKALMERVEALFYDLLELRHGGWENNDGAFGEFTWHLTSDELKQTHHSRFTEVETFEHDGFDGVSAEGL